MLGQSKILKKRFKEKKYPQTIIEGAFKRAAAMTQESCIAPKINKTNTKQINNFKRALISTYNRSHKQIKSILSRHWYILKNDPYLGKDLTDKPPLVYRRGKTLKHYLAQSDINKQGKKISIQTNILDNKNIGCFKCFKSR